jgi:hypothetical protein
MRASPDVPYSRFVIACSLPLYLLCAHFSNQSFLVYLNHPRLVNLRDLVLRVHRDRLIAMPSEHPHLGINTSTVTARRRSVRNIASYCRPVSGKPVKNLEYG